MIEIRSFQPNDTDQIIKLVLDIQQLEFQVPITIEQQPDLQIISQFYQKDKGNFWVATHENQVVGSIALIDCGEGVGCIRKMFVKKEFRGSQFGIAQNLLNHLIQWSVEKGIERLYLGTIERLAAAIAFYKKNGFTLIEKTNLPQTFPIMEVDTHFFEKNISQANFEIITYDPRFQKEFKEINVEWIEVNFVVEKHDLEQLDNPQWILDNGGEIYLAA